VPGTAIEDAEKTVREVISSQLRPVKVQAARVLRNERLETEGCSCKL
jgi:hypothetical protein